MATQRSSARVMVTFDQSISLSDNTLKNPFGVEPPETAILALPLSFIACARISLTDCAKVTSNSFRVENSVNWCIIQPTGDHHARLEK